MRAIKAMSSQRNRCMSLGCAGVDQPANGGNSIGRNTNALCVFLDDGFVWSEIDAVNFIAGDVAV